MADRNNDLVCEVGPKSYAVLSRYPSGKAAAIVYAETKKRLDQLMATLKPELEYAVVPREFVGRDVQETIDRAADLTWISLAVGAGPQQRLRNL
jgi:predicted LPLAT superfamily acyltransferase